MPEIDLRLYAQDIWSIVQDGINRKVLIIGESTSFLDLKDTPTSYSGEGGKTVKVKADETGLEFV